ncbi:MAG: hypothetical protein F7B06_06470 [Opitutae bacterium]|nr:hypothetical protein [Opitutae bacterium]
MDFVIIKKGKIVNCLLRHSTKKQLQLARLSLPAHTPAIDSEAGLRALAKHFLRNAGYEISASGNAAFHFFDHNPDRDHNPDLDLDRDRGRIHSRRNYIHSFNKVYMDKL